MEEGSPADFGNETKLFPGMVRIKAMYAGVLYPLYVPKAPLMSNMAIAHYILDQLRLFIIDGNVGLEGLFKTPETNADLIEDEIYRIVYSGPTIIGGCVDIEELKNPTPWQYDGAYIKSCNKVANCDTTGWFGFDYRKEKERYDRGNV